MLESETNLNPSDLFDTIVDVRFHAVGANVSMYKKWALKMPSSRIFGKQQNGGWFVGLFTTRTWLRANTFVLLGMLSNGINPSLKH